VRGNISTGHIDVLEMISEFQCTAAITIFPGPFSSAAFTFFASIYASPPQGMLRFFPIIVSAASTA
jgi:hypothetical protein